MQKYQVRIPGVLESEEEAIAVRFPKSVKIDSEKAKVLLTAGNPRGLSGHLARQKAQKFALGLQKIDLGGGGERPFSEPTEHLAI